ncbi:MAG: glycosyl transferase [Bacteroidetes bacterium 4572_77]|nr:MAG: glycosyl transferase [Bacteroidetes bacterium 4572_77]
MLKRLFNIILSFVGLLIISPLLLFISVAIMLDTKGGIIYKQKRVGKNNVDFFLLKFRSMSLGSQEKGLLTIGQNDARITKVGQFIRRYKLDELPQLFNVLKGEMNLVGPRPEVRKYVDLYTLEQKEILKVKPGITDYASMEYVDENNLLAQSENPEKTYMEEIMPHKLELNKKYLANPSIWHDIKIIFYTIMKI